MPRPNASDPGRQGQGLGRLTGLGLVASALPLLAGLIVVLTLEWRHAEDAQAQRLAAAAALAGRAADAEIEARRLALLAFGEARSGAGGWSDLTAVDAAARQLAGLLGSPIGVLDRGLGLLVDTREPFGTPLPSTPAIAAGLWAVETGRARVSEVLQGPGGTTLPPKLMVPLLRDGRVEQVLSVDLAVERLGAVLGPGRAALVDNRGRIVASSGGETPELTDWPEISPAPQGTPRVWPNGRVRYVVHFLGEAPEWRVVAWEPANAGSGALHRMLPPVLAAILLAVLLGALAWRRALRALHGSLRELGGYAGALAEALRADAPLPAPPAGSGPAEIAALGAALATTQQAFQQRERRLRALAEAGALVLWRADASGGWQEAAGWAGLTGQAAQAARGDGWIEMVHPDDRAPTLAEWGRALVARGAIGVEFRLRMADEDARWRWVRATGVPITGEDGVPLEWVGAIHDVSDVRGAGAAQRVNEQQVRQTVAELRAVYDTVPVGLALVDPQLRFVNVNARFAAISGLPTEAHISRAPHEVMPEGLAAPIEAAQRQVLETGRPVLDVACSGQAPGMVQNVRHWLASCHPVKSAEGVVTGVSAVLQDVTDRVRSERSRELLMNELSHRVKNTLATVQSIAAQSMRRPRPGEPAPGRDFVARLQALTRSHDLLAEHGWEKVDLTRVVRAALRPWLDSGRAIRLAGSGRIQLDPAQVQAVILALNELAGNALRYGALSRGGGEVEVNWALDEEGVATLSWSESGGPPVTPPPQDRRGFGVRLLERGVAHDLGPGAEVRLSFPEDGVQAVIRFRAGLPVLEPEAAA